MAALDDLLARISDPALRDALSDEIKPLRGEQELGLVFERHLPETARLYGHPVRRGLTVALRADQSSPVWEVIKVRDSVAHVQRVDDDMNVIVDDYPVEDLVVVREFGDPIYPGLQTLGRVERGGDKPFHSVIEAENFHALETLLYAYEGQVDCIFADPPYNSGARDWRYSNDYVDSNDRNRHSKWLSFMEKRLRLAKRLLNPEDSVLIVTIDEREYLRLGLLLEQVFSNADIQMVTSVINGSGVARGDKFSRAEEYLFVVFVGSARPMPQGSDMLNGEGSSADDNETSPQRIDIWNRMMRRGTAARREDRPKQFYPFWIDEKGRKIHSVGEPIDLGVSRTSVQAPEPGLVACWPLRSDDSEGRWQLGADAARTALDEGTLRLGAYSSKKGRWSISYLRAAEKARIERGEIAVLGRDQAGALILQFAHQNQQRVKQALTVWYQKSHNAGLGGTNLLRSLLPGRAFPFPKSLYAVEDALRFFISRKTDALVLDFFGGSGTTSHAVMRLNHQDGGRRRSILVTNNEVGADEQAALLSGGLLPGDPDWEARGIFEFVTKPRIEAAVTGRTPDGKPVKGAYKFVDEFPMADGLEENVEFFRLTYEDPDRVELGVSFEAIAPLLWLKAGAQGERVDRVDPVGWTLPDGGRYGVLFNPDMWREFVEHLATRDDVTHAFLVTDSDAVFQQVVAELPAGVEPVRLYGGYLTSFAINTGGAS